MEKQIPEQDWKVFKEVHPVAMERFAHGSVAAIRRALEAGKTDHERFWGISDLIKKRQEKLASLFDDYRRSTALIMLALIRCEGLLTDQEMARFSVETQDYVRAIEEMSQDAKARRS